MERKPIEVGHRVGSQPEYSDLTHPVTGNGEVARSVVAELAKSREALQAALAQAAAAVGQGIHEKRDEVIAYARRQPAAALTAAVGIGFLVGLALAIGARGSTGGGLPQLTSRRSFLGRGRGSGWRGFLRLE
jgi:hypothetical protein